MRTPLLLLLSLVLSFVARAADPAQSIARILPPKTVMFAELHNLPRSVERMSGSLWGELARDPEVSGFFSKLTAALSDEMPGEARKVLGEIAAVAPVGGFIALTEMPELESRASEQVPKFLIGGSYRGEAQRAEALMGMFRTEVLKTSTVKQSKESIDGVEVETFADSNFSLSVVHVAADKFILAGTDKKGVLDALARRAGRGTPSLADDENWKIAAKEALGDEDVSAYFSYQTIFEKLPAKPGADLAAIAMIRNLMPQFLSVSTKIDGRLMRERMYFHSQMVLPRAESKHRSLAFTGSDTYAYLEMSLAGSIVPIDKFIEAIPELKGASSELEAQGLALADIAKTFGPEFAVISDWESGGLAFPSLFVAVEVRDAEKAQKFAKLITSAMKAEGDLKEREHRGAKLWSMPGPIPLLQPTLALSETHLMFGLNVASVKDALDHAASGKSALAESETFRSALKTVGDTNNGLAYIDSAHLLGRLYDRLRPFITSGIAGNPSLRNFLDASQVPKTETLTRHMLPFAMSFHGGEHGFTMESTGPVTYISGVGGVATVAGFILGVRNGVEKAREKARDKQRQLEKSI